MIELYCNGKRHGKEMPCVECARLLTYAIERVMKCPFMETKTFCSNCRVRCYQGAEREQIRQVMIFRS